MHEIRMLGDLGKTIGKKTIADFTIPLANDILPALVINTASNSSSNAQQKFEREVSRKVGKGFNLLISNEDMNDIMKIVESIENSGLLIGGASKTRKHKLKKARKMDFFLL